MKSQSLAAALFAAAGVGSLAPPAVAENVTGVVLDPTRRGVYWNFTIDEPADSYKIIIKDAAGATVVVRTLDPGGAGVPFFPTHAGFSGNVLTPATSYTLNIRVHWPSHAGFDPEWVTIPFTTSP